jgi:heme/copper-type cytochrome/quinol oxidase subunit 2
MQTALPGKRNKQTINTADGVSSFFLSLLGFWFVSFILFYFIFFSKIAKKKTFETCYEAAVPFSRALVSVVFPSRIIAVMFLIFFTIIIFIDTSDELFIDTSGTEPNKERRKKCIQL